jgi:hypothetical protein
MNKITPVKKRLFLITAVFALLAGFGCAGAAEPAADPIVGHWKWFNSDLKIFHPNGTMATITGDGQSGTWKRISNRPVPRYKLNWSKGRYIDIVTMRGNEVYGTNQYGLRITGTHVAPPDIKAGKP